MTNRAHQLITVLTKWFLRRYTKMTV